MLSFKFSKPFAKRSFNITSEWPLLGENFAVNIFSWEKHLKDYMQTKRSCQLNIVFWDLWLYLLTYEVFSFLKKVTETTESNIFNIFISGNSFFITKIDSIEQQPHRRCSIKKLFLKLSQYSQESICIGVYNV